MTTPNKTLALPVQPALPDQGMDCAHYRPMIDPKTGAKYWEQVVTHFSAVEPTAQPTALPVEPPVAGDPDGAKVARLMGLLDTLPDTTNLANRAVFKAALYQEFGSAALPVEPATKETK